VKLITRFLRIWHFQSRLSLVFEAVVAGSLITALTTLSVFELRTGLHEAEIRRGWVERSRNVIASGAQLGRAASDVQSGARGYALLKDPSTLQQYYFGSQKFQSVMKSLLALSPDDPAQRARLERMEKLFQSYRDGAAAILLLERPSGAFTPEQHKAVQAGNENMRQIREAVDQFIATEQERLTNRENASIASNRRVTYLFLLVPILVVVAGALGALAFAMRVSGRIRTVTATAQSIAKGDFRGRIPISSNQEFGELALAFNTMAEELEARLKQDSLMNSFRELLHSAQTRVDAQAAIARFGPKCVPEADGSLFLLNASRNLLEHAGGWGKPVTDASFPPSACWSLQIGKSHMVTNPESDVQCEHLADKCRPTICIPLLAQGETVGMLLLVLRGVQRPKFAVEVAEAIAQTIANLRLKEAMQIEATCDVLTGLYNRRYLNDSLEREFARTRGCGSSLAVIALDIDHFKHFNDTYGHSAGDAVLKHLTLVLKGTLRTTDIVCRQGGEEFLAVLPGCDLPGAAKRAEAIRTAVRELSFVHNGQVIQNITISAGVAVFPEHGSTPEELTHAADQALYRSKQDGRNRVTVVGILEPASGLQLSPVACDQGQDLQLPT
jgi:diguanylate cyclase (GGDEF)-like protein